MVLSLNRDSDHTLHQQICAQIREQIRSGRLPPGLKMPSTRTLVNEYGISRNVFITAFEQLLAEGYLISRRGSGTFVSDKIDPALFPSPPVSKMTQVNNQPPRILYDFSLGIPDLSEFPQIEWGRCLRKAVSQLRPSEMAYGNSGGTLRLKKALKEHLLISRGMNIREEQLFVCSGSHQALLLAVKACLDETEKKSIIIENPAYNALTQSIIQCGGMPVPIRCDKEGIMPEKIPHNGTTALITVTPSHLFPSGTVLPIHRRLELCRIAEDLDCYILENEFEGDLRLKGSPVPSMQFLKKDRILSTGTFSQIMYPAIRLGYLIVPEEMISRVGTLYKLLGYGVPVSHQNGIAVFMEEGLLLRHYRKMKRLYLNKQNALIEILEKEFGSELKLTGVDTGTFLSASIKGVEFSDKIAAQLAEAGFLADFEYRHYWPAGTVKQAPGIMLGFGNLSEQRMFKGIECLASTLNHRS